MPAVHDSHPPSHRRRERLLRGRMFSQRLCDPIAAPLWMILLPDATCRRLGLTSLEDERLRAVLPEIQGRLLDIGVGTNRLVELYGNGVGVDVVDWGGSAIVVEDTRNLPFDDASFETVTFVACLNHIPYRDEVLQEAWRLLRPGARVIVTMIGRWVGGIGHRLWWYSEDKHREIAEGELTGMDPHEATGLLTAAGFEIELHRRFVYGLNHLFIARKPQETRP